MFHTEVRSKKTIVTIGRDLPAVIIGERINPTGKKKFGQALLAKDYDYVRSEAIAQVEQGADMLDVNVGVAGIDEVAMLPEVIKIVSETVNVPLCIDSANPVALAAALKVYEGKALVNSVTGEEKSLESVLPLIKEYGAAVVGLLMDDTGIPNDPEKRLAIALKIVERAEKLGIERSNIIIDCLTMTVSSDHNAAAITLKTIERIVEELGTNIILGISNVSFGLPDRNSITKTMLAMALRAGLTCIIMDPTAEGMRRTVKTSDLLLGRDEWSMNYLAEYRLYSEPQD
ncbi:dihydropteroate synthase [Desulfosporosinus sp. BICA1-9]|uniref:dihydropteroate synthase n=1 Tax=Desulfosporosinus sp. BICA1-9 TaxID=1531958 RepID=UPI00054B495B|nr:dihydropteroate synthase [Desulfosporosinus sp. BICA1-9]KJS47004.1 MAG: pterin-binding protein [Peptococcaceae bacterium BRH_c23]KJS82202.1 MAG: pterin-binding protein [Desulfosporosinus sp. BICA1-9]